MDIITLALAKKQIGKDTTKAVSDYLDEHLTNPTNPPLDTSLTIANAAADSKATGDKLSELKEGLNQLDIDKLSLSNIEKIPLTWTQGKYINSNGWLSTASAPYATLDYIPIKKGRLYVNVYAASSYYCCLYNADKTVRGEPFHIQYENGIEITEDGYIRLTTNATYVAPEAAYLIQTTVQDSNVLSDGMTKFLTNSGYEAVNLINTDDIVSGYRLNTETGRLGKASAFSSTGFIPVMPNGLYKFSRPSASLSEVVCLYGKSYGFVSAMEVGNNNSYIQIPDNPAVYYMRVSVSNFPENPTIKLVGKGERVYHITPSEGILAGVKAARDTMANIIVVDAGSYDLIAEYKAEYGEGYFTNYAESYNGRVNGSWDYGVWLDNVIMRFSPGAIVTAEYDGANANVVSDFSAFAMGYNVEIDGLNLECKNLRYGIHPDFWTSFDGYDKTPYLTIKNCTLHNYRENDSSENQNAAIGAGFPMYGNWLIENCYIKSDTAKRVIRMHNNAAAGAKSKLVIRGCVIKGNGYIEVNSYGASEEVSEVFVYGCKMSGPARSVIEGSSSVYENVKVYSFANDYPESGGEDEAEMVYSNNLLDASSCVNGKYIDVDGTEKTSSLDPPAAYTDYFIPVEPGDVIVGTYANLTTPSNLYKVCAYDTDKNPLSALGMSSIGASYTVPEGVAYIKVSARWFLSQSNGRLNKNGVIEKYMPFYEGTVRDTAESNYENIGDLIRYPLTSMPSYVLKNLAYKPLGQLSKGYICFVSDDGRADLANYTIPMFVSKGVPGTWAVMSQSEVLADTTMTATVVDSVQNHGCEIAMHGLSNWDSYDEYFLNQYFDWQDRVFADLGLTAYGAVCPSHHINEVISAVAGPRYGCLRTGFGYGTPYYDNYMNGARSNLYGLSCYGLTDGTLQSQKDHIDKAISDHLLCIVFWHDNSLTTEMRERFEEIIDYAKTSGITFVTMKDIPTIV